ncbi:hypothetical protein BDW71DRAFT_178445 [Aspergillus fruticulosus]
MHCYQDLPWLTGTGGPNLLSLILIGKVLGYALGVLLGPIRVYQPVHAIIMVGYWQCAGVISIRAGFTSSGDRLRALKTSLVRLLGLSYLSLCKVSTISTITRSFDGQCLCLVCFPPPQPTLSLEMLDPGSFSHILGSCFALRLQCSLLWLLY